MEFKYVSNIIYFIIPIMSIFLMIYGFRKKQNILTKLKIEINLKFKYSRIVFIFIGLLCMVFSLLGPQMFNGFSESTKRGIDIFILIDTSKSMLVEDIKPSRISRAKKIIESLIDNLDGDRIGIIPFTSDAYVQMPLTDDYDLANMFVDVIDTDMIGGGGTRISRAIDLAQKSFKNSASTNKVIIILSDGEQHDKKEIDTLNNTNFEKLNIFTIGIGSDKGGLIPIYDDSTNQKVTYKKDSSGNFIMSRLNDDTLKHIANLGNGNYYKSCNELSEISSIIKDISTLEESILTTRKIKKFNLLYQYFLGVGILLFLVAYFLPERSNLK